MQEKNDKYKNGRGRFYHKLLMSLLIASSFFALISLIIFVIVLNQVSMIEKRTNENAFINQVNTVNIASMTLSQFLDSVDTYYLDSWVDSDISNYRYYYALKLYSWIRSSNDSLNGIAYSTSLISNSSDEMVITPVGTCDFDYYIKSYTNLRDDDISLLSDMIVNKESQIASFASYNANGVITDLYVAIPYFSENENNMVFFTRFYLSRFFNISENQHSFLVTPSGKIISNSIMPEENELYSIVKKYAENKTYQEILDEDKLYHSFLANIQWIYISYFDTSNHILTYFIIWSTLLLGYAVLIYLLVFNQARRLYNPLSKVIADGNKETVIDKNTDEIGLLEKKNAAFLHLSKELKEANLEMKRYATVRTYRALLESDNDEYINDKTHYCVALIRFNDNKNISGNILAFQLTLQAKEQEGIGYVPYGFNRFALILKVENIENGIQKLQDILHWIPNNIDVTSVLSDIVIGKNQLKSGYRQCLKLLDYSSVFHSYQIITADDIASLNTKTDFNYSLEDETFLLKLIISGNPQAKDELNEIYSKNKHGLSYEVKHNLAICLLTTLNRVFSELKTSPEEIIGQSISYTAMLSELSAEDLLNRVKELFLLVIDQVSNNTSKSDNQMLALMEKYIQENYMNNIGLQNLADKFNITSKYCGMVFSKLSNDNFRNYLNKIRVEEAKKIIEDNPLVKVQDLGHMVGFNSSTSFIRVFVKYVGVTPKAYADSIAYEKN